MRVGVPREIKVLENRVGLTPASVRELVARGHAVVVERDAGAGIGLARRRLRRRRRDDRAGRRRGVRRRGA